MRGRRARAAAAALAAALLAPAVTACAAAPPRAAPSATARGAVEEGLASYYADRFQGRRTASGAPYDREGLTCAHRSHPFGARLEVVAVETGRRVEVTVTDRGPHVAGRVVDLSRAAARALGIEAQGVAPVRVRRVR